MRTWKPTQNRQLPVFCAALPTGRVESTGLGSAHELSHGAGRWRS